MKAIERDLLAWARARNRLHRATVCAESVEEISALRALQDARALAELRLFKRGMNLDYRVKEGKLK